MQKYAQLTFGFTFYITWIGFIFDSVTFYIIEKKYANDRNPWGLRLVIIDKYLVNVA